MRSDGYACDGHAELDFVDSVWPPSTTHTRAPLDAAAQDVAQDLDRQVARERGDVERRARLAAHRTRRESVRRRDLPKVNASSTIGAKK
jgi:hypothetical protein